MFGARRARSVSRCVVLGLRSTAVANPARNFCRQVGVQPLRDLELWLQAQRLNRRGNPGDAIAQVAALAGGFELPLDLAQSRTQRVSSSAAYLRNPGRRKRISVLLETMPNDHSGLHRSSHATCQVAQCIAAQVSRAYQRAREAMKIRSRPSASHTGSRGATTAR